MKFTAKRWISLLVVMVMVLTLSLTMSRVRAAEAKVITEDQIDTERVMYTFTADDFSLPYSSLGNGDCVIDDPLSSEGKAAVLDAKKRAEFGDKGMVNALIRGADQCLTVYSQGDPYVAVGEISLAQLKENTQTEGYTLYRFNNVEMMPGAGEYFIYIFDCWGFQVRLTQEQQDAIRATKVDFYLSLNITGNIGDSENDMPTYYIDKIIIAESDPNAVHEHTFGNWGVDTETHRRICQECGEMEQGEHQWDDGVVTKEATDTEDGEKVYTCKDCSKTKSIVLKALNAPEDDKTDDTNKTPVKTDSDNTIVIVVVALIVVAVGVAVAAVLLLKKKKA